MEAKYNGSKFNGGVKRIKNAAITASETVADTTARAREQARGNVEHIVKWGRLNLQETADKATHIAQKIAKKAVDAGHETSQKLIERAKNMAGWTDWGGWNWPQTTNVSDLMTTAVRSCTTGDNLQRAAQIMWESDCGVVPVVESDGRLVGMITDRDICMAAYTQGKPLSHIGVFYAMAKEVHGVHDTDRVEAAEDLMRRVRVRRVPVLDRDGRLKGILSMNDLARHVRRSPVGRSASGLSTDRIAWTLAAICERPNGRAVKQANGTPLSA
jgi:CBS domain-containing protein